MNLLPISLPVVTWIACCLVFATAIFTHAVRQVGRPSNGAKKSSDQEPDLQQTISDIDRPHKQGFFGQMPEGGNLSLALLLFVPGFRKHKIRHAIMPLILLGGSGYLMGCGSGSTLSGGGTSTPPPPPPPTGVTVQGKVLGPQPVVGAHVYLMAVAVSGVGSAGYGQASTSLLNSGTGDSDTIGDYVATDSNGAFSLDQYSCPSTNTQVYLYAAGGNPGTGTNSAASFMAALGSCGSLSSSTTTSVNEVSTIAAAYALAGFAKDTLHISIPQYVTGTKADTLAQTDLQNAFATVNNLVNSSTGAALTVTPGGNGTPETSQVITLANILAACVNSNGTTANPGNCSTLFSNAGSTGGTTGAIPTDTATAAINIAHYPGVSSTVIGSLYGLQAAGDAPFAGGDSTTPNDFTIAISYTGGGMSGFTGVAIDASGNAWVANTALGGGGSVSEFSSTGTAVSPSSGYTGGGLNQPASLAIDASGNIWLPNGNSNAISEFSSTGTAISPSTGYAGGGLGLPQFVAIDSSGNAWATTGSSLSEFSSSGMAISPSTGYTGGGLADAYQLAVDASGNVWAANGGSSTTTPGLSEFSSTGTPVSPTGYSGGGMSGPSAVAIDSSGNVWTASLFNLSEVSSSGTAISSDYGYTGGGLSIPLSIAIDGSGNVWADGLLGGTLSEFSSSGTPISPGTGYTGGGSGLSGSMAIDGSGNVWELSSGNNALIEFVGVATPVVTPVVANLITPYSAPASKP
jgi:hypothetical protein